MEEQVIEQNIKETEIEGFGVEAASPEELATLEEMMRVGMMYGHKKSKTNPKFKPYIYTTRNGLEVIDLGQTLQALDAAALFLKAKMQEGAVVLFVAMQPAAREAVLRLTEKFNFSYVNESWIGGLLTNFKVIVQRIEYFKKIRSDWEKGLLEKYTKKERSVISKNIERMKKMFTGLENLGRTPDVLFIIDPSLKGHTTALREAKRLKIKTIAIVDSDDNPDEIDYPIPANDHSKSSIRWVLSRIDQRLAS